jgi:hypothetical protein
MDISKFAKKPELIKIVLNTPEIMETYGSEVSFWIMDSVDLSTYFDFYKSQADQDGDKLAEIMRKLIRNEAGEPAMAAGEILPVDLAIAALTEIGNQLGKSRTKPLDPTTGPASNS